MRIGLTGGIGSGKSTVAEFFAELGVPIVDTDEIARELVVPEREPYKQIVAQFGEGILAADGSIDRAKLRTLVFENAAQRQRLESILHPPIRDEAHRRLAALDAPYAIVVVPLLTETNFDYMVNRILVVDCDEALQIERAAARSGMDADQVRRIMDAQTSRAKRLERADDIIENNGTLEALRERVRALHQRYLAMAAVPQR